MFVVVPIVRFSVFLWRLRLAQTYALWREREKLASTRTVARQGRVGELRPCRASLIHEAGRAMIKSDEELLHLLPHGLARTADRAQESLKFI